MFQSTRPRRARLYILIEWIVTFCFNPRAREGRDRYKRLHGRNVFCFNPRAREGRDRRQQLLFKLTCQFQSTRPRRARPPDGDGFEFFKTVSIHAPAKGATKVAKPK